MIYCIDTSVLDTTRKIHKNYTSGSRVVYFPKSHRWVYRWRKLLMLWFIYNSKLFITYHFLNFTYTFSKALLIFCHCRALFSSMLFLKIIVNNVLFCCAVNLSRFKPVKGWWWHYEYMKVIYVNCGVKNYLKEDHRSYIRSLCSYEKKEWKKKKKEKRFAQFEKFGILHCIYLTATKRLIRTWHGTILLRIRFFPCTETTKGHKV